MNVLLYSRAFACGVLTPDLRATAKAEKGRAVWEGIVLGSAERQSGFAEMFEHAGGSATKHRAADFWRCGSREIASVQSPRPIALSAEAAQLMRMSQSRVRRTHAERSATTRQSLLDAAISVLYENGFGGTTTSLIAQKAGTTRGAILHHFPTTTDLMAFVVEQVYADEAQEYDKLLRGADDPLQLPLAYVDAAWEIISRPAGVAVLEILQGSRSDPELASKLEEIIARIEANAFSSVQQQLGRVPSRPLLGLVVWAMRGLSVAKILASDTWAPEQSVAMLRFLIETAIRTGNLQDGLPKRH